MGATHQHQRQQPAITLTIKFYFSEPTLSSLSIANWVLLISSYDYISRGTMPSKSSLFYALADISLHMVTLPRRWRYDRMFTPTPSHRAAWWLAEFRWCSFRGKVFATMLTNMKDFTLLHPTGKRPITPHDLQSLLIVYCFGQFYFRHRCYLNLLTPAYHKSLSGVNILRNATINHSTLQSGANRHLHICLITTKNTRQNRESPHLP